VWGKVLRAERRSAGQNFSLYEKRGERSGVRVSNTPRKGASSMLDMTNTVGKLNAALVPRAWNRSKEDTCKWGGKSAERARWTSGCKRTSCPRGEGGKQVWPTGGEEKPPGVRELP